MRDESTNPDGTPGDGWSDLPEEWTAMARDAYNPPGEPPRDAMWREIEARIGAHAPKPGSGGADVTPLRPRTRWIPLAAAAGTALLLGVGLGRMSTEVPPGAPPASAPRAEAPVRGATPAARLATARHLGDAEALLAFVSADAREGRTDRQLGVWGRGLLTRTRLFLDSPVAADPAVRSLLEELEVVLAQVALLADPDVADERLESELRLIADGLERAGVQGRIRSALPGMAPGSAMADDE